MGLYDGYDVAGSGMGAQRTRINVVSANIANAQTTHTKDGGPYKKQNVVFEEMLMQSSKTNNSQNIDAAKNAPLPLSGVGVKSVLESKDEPMMKFEINTPDDYIGNVVGDLNKRRGKIESMRRYRKGSRLHPKSPAAGEQFPIPSMYRGIGEDRGRKSQTRFHKKALGRPRACPEVSTGWPALFWQGFADDPDSLLRLPPDRGLRLRPSIPFLLTPWPTVQ